MKRSDLSKLVGAGILAISLTTLPLSLPASAQSPDASPTVEDTTKPTFDTTPLQETKDDNNNLGWLGLIGLIGLVNLFRKPKQPAVYTEPEVDNRGSSR